MTKNPCIPCSDNDDCTSKENVIGDENCVKDNTRDDKCCWNLD